MASKRWCVTSISRSSSAAELLQEIEVTHQRFEAKLMTYEEFEEKKAELLSRLPID